jgi:hypothetical protein
MRRSGALLIRGSSPGTRDLHFPKNRPVSIRVSFSTGQL